MCSCILADLKSSKVNNFKAPSYLFLIPSYTLAVLGNPSNPLMDRVRGDVDGGLQDHLQLEDAILLRWPWHRWGGWSYVTRSKIESTFRAHRNHEIESRKLIQHDAMINLSLPRGGTVEDILSYYIVKNWLLDYHDYLVIVIISNDQICQEAHRWTQRPETILGCSLCD